MRFRRLTRGTNPQNAKKRLRQARYEPGREGVEKKINPKNMKGESNRQKIKQCTLRCRKAESKPGAKKVLKKKRETQQT